MYSAHMQNHPSSCLCLSLCNLVTVISGDTRDTLNNKLTCALKCITVNPFQLAVLYWAYHIHYKHIIYVVDL